MEHQYNEPPHNEVPGIMSDIVHPNNVKISGKVPHDNQNLVVVRMLCQLLGPSRIEVLL